MRALGITALVIVLVIGGGLAWCNFAYPAYTYRYRTTVEVMVDGVVHSGSSVVEVEIQTQPNLLSNSTIVPHVNGEATFVDLGGGRNVIALLASGPNGSNVGYPYQLIPRLFHISYEDRDLPKLAGLRGRREIPESDLPTLVTLANLSDPKSARVIKPAELSQEFGSGVRLQGAYIEMTEDPPTQNIETRLPELMRKLNDEAKVSTIQRLGDPFRINSGQFKRSR